jgi:hypothetical protein
MPNVRFVGRDQELRVLAAAYAADGGEASLVVVGGDASVGKTRLLAEVTGTLDALVLRGGCPPLGATGLPFSPIVEVLRALTGPAPAAGESRRSALATASLAPSFRRSRSAQGRPRASGRLPISGPTSRPPELIRFSWVLTPLGPGCFHPSTYTVK